MAGCYLAPFVAARPGCPSWRAAGRNSHNGGTRDRGMNALLRTSVIHGGEDIRDCQSQFVVPPETGVGIGATGVMLGQKVHRCENVR